MDVPNLFTQTAGPQEARLFLALTVTDTHIQAALWQIKDGRISTISQSQPTDYKDAKQLLKKADQCLQDLGKLSEGIDEVVFGFELGWVTKDGIADDKKPLLKKLTEELDLKPVGFVVTAEALFHHFLKKDQHLSALLLQYSQQNLTVSLIERGKLKKSEVLGRSGNAVSDLMEGLARFKGTKGTTHLPARIFMVGILLEKKDLHKEQQALLKHQWHSTHSFVHAPTLDTLPEETVLEAIVAEGGRAVVESQGYQVSKQAAIGVGATEVAAASQNSKPPAADGPGSKQIQGGEKAVTDDLVDKTPLSVPKSFGIPMSFRGAPATDANVHQNVQTVEDMPQLHAQESSGGESFIKKPISKITGLASGIMSKVRPSKNPAPPPDDFPEDHPSWLRSHRHFALGGFVAGVAALFLIGAIFLLSSKKAEVVLSLKTESLSEDVLITLDSSLAESNPSQLLLKASLLSEEVDGSKTIDTSGVKLVGERATGKMTVINKSDSEKSFSAGTRLTVGELAFTLDEEIKVASASVSTSADGETKTYGKTEVTVTASQIGADSNLAKDTELTVDDFSQNTYSAVAAEQFSGGSSREVRVVSQEDRNEVLTQLTQDLSQKAKEALEEKAEAGKYIVPTGEVEVKQSQYDAEVGDEVKTLTLDAVLVVSAAVYTNEDLEPLVLEVMKDKIPDGFELSEAEPNILSQPDEAATASARVTLNTNITVSAQPIIDQASWKREVAGQSVSSAEAIFRAKGEVDEVEITLSPSILRLFSNSLPKKEDAINFSFKQP